MTHWKKHLGSHIHERQVSAVPFRQFDSYTATRILLMNEVPFCAKKPIVELSPGGIESVADKAVPWLEDFALDADAVVDNDDVVVVDDDDVDDDDVDDDDDDEVEAVDDADDVDDVDYVHDDS